MLECFEQEGPATSGGTQTFQSVSPAELHSAVWREKSGQNVRLAHRPEPVFLILPMPAGAADAADDADSRSQRDNPRRKKRQRDTNHSHAPHQRACALLNGAAQGRRQTRPLRYQITLGINLDGNVGRRSRLPIELRWQAARLPYKFLIPMPH